MPIYPGVSSTATAWVANRAVFTRLPKLNGSFRYVRFTIGTAAGNVQVGVVRLSGTGDLTYTRVMDSGVIASPASGVQRLDLGRTSLSGEHALFFWGSSTSLTIGWAGLNTSNKVPSITTVDSLASGVAASGTLAAWGGTDAIGFFVLEADV